MNPVIFEGTFGWLSTGHLRRGVVLCGTLGFEQHSAHRWWRDLAEGIAGTGCAVLRFNLPGEGDSAAETTRLDASLDTIRAAVRFLRDEAELEEVVLVGLRFGGTLASLVAAEFGIERLVLLAPFPRGRSYLREMNIQARIIDIVPDGGPLPKPSDGLSVGGFGWHPHFLEDLAPIDLFLTERPPAQRILFLGPDPARLAARYAELGSTVEVADCPGLASLLADALQTRMPEETRARILAFVSEDAPLRSSRPPRRRRARVEMAGEGWYEEPVGFADGLFGIRCGPHTASPKAPVVLFVNMGPHVHSGYGRQTTTLARTLAQEGIPSLRMDLRGVGDSADRTDGQLPMYVLDAVEDIRAAVDMLTRDGGRPVIAVGTCNGAYLSFHAICQDPRISAAVLINLYCFDWDLTHGGVPYSSKPVRHTSAYVSLLLTSSTWRRMLTGSVPVATIFGKLARRGFAQLRDKIIRRAEPWTRSPSIPERIAELRRRGATLLMLYSAGDLGLVDLTTQLGSLGRAEAILGEPVRIVADADHSFAAIPARAMLLQELQRIAATLTVEDRVTDGSTASAIGRLAPAGLGPFQPA